MARGGRAAGGPPGVDRASGRDARRDRQAPAAVAASAWPRSAASTRARCAAAGRALLEAIERGRERPPIPVVGERPSHPDALDAPVIALAEALVRARALEAQLAYELLASRADLQRIVLAVRDGEPEPDVRTLRGWRRELVGAELLALLAGRRTLRVGPDRRIDVSP